LTSDFVSHDAGQGLTAVGEFRTAGQSMPSTAMKSQQWRSNKTSLFFRNKKK
jgi:hypothetical protein